MQMSQDMSMSDVLMSWMDLVWLQTLGFCPLPNGDAWSETTVLCRIKCFQLGATSPDYGFCSSLRDGKSRLWSGEGHIKISECGVDEPEAS
jgi:hypothetical protein